MTVQVDLHKLPIMLTALRLPSFQRHWQELAERADSEGWQAARFLAALAELELALRDTRRIQRHLAEARLPAGKTLATFEFAALPAIPKAKITALAAGDWLDAGANLIAIGNSGSGKTHILSAIGHALVEAGYRVLYTRTTDLVQRLQAARRDLALEAALAKLDKFHLLILDDITYAHKDQAETSVLFELIATLQGDARRGAEDRLGRHRRPARRPRRYPDGSNRQPMPPGAGPSLLPADGRIKRAEGGAGRYRSILNGLRRPDGAAQPGWHSRHARGRRGAERLDHVPLRRLGAENHRRRA
ncbi:DNA replication protein DnaC [Mesorhizobium albiziae]|uniref:DNA replication protein DnaC n=1 Tax=Neomesorhizobium albiziae TaxID=335020 RepID=A0A1I4F586_9HYPH|nr:hypothetical protein GCM10007937_25410 [Mesorhizobium albiziae]SFL12613.1 DNA replication protein DnaC [Mesorhizobium albiziae]